MQKVKTFKNAILLCLIFALTFSGFAFPVKSEAALTPVTGIDGKKYSAGMNSTGSAYVIYRNDVEITTIYTGGSSSDYPALESFSVSGDTMSIVGKWRYLDGGKRQTYTVSNLSKYKDKIVVATGGYSMFDFPRDSTQRQVKIGRKGRWQTLNGYQQNLTTDIINQTSYARAISSSGELLEASFNVPYAYLYGSTSRKTESPDGTIYTVYNGQINMGTAPIHAEREDGTKATATLYKSNDMVYSEVKNLYWSGNSLYAAFQWRYANTTENAVFYNLAKGDFTPPVINLSRTNNSSIVNATITDNVGVTSAKWASGIQYESYFASNGKPLVNDAFEVPATGNYTVYAKDAAGNESIKVIMVDKIVEAPKPATFTLSTEKPTQTVTISISYPTESVKSEYKIGSDGVWEEYVGPITLTENKTVFARSTNVAGVQSVESKIEVTNVDNVAPEKPQVVVNQNRVSIVPVDPNDVAVIEYRINGGEWVTYTTEIVLDKGSYTIETKAIDESGNESEVVSHTFDVAVDFSGVTKAVEYAEANPTQFNVDVAQDLVNTLPTSPEQKDLQTRLNEVQKNIDLYDEIQRQINDMQDALNKGIVALPQIKDYQDRIDGLRKDVKTLPDTMDKNHLNTQLDELELKIKLIEKVLKAKDNVRVEDVDLDDLQDQIDNLPDGDLKDELQDQLDQAKDLQDAINKVDNAEKTKSQEDVDTARDAVNKLPDGRAKNGLNNRLDEVQREIDNAKVVAEQIQDAIKKVEKAEGSKTQTDVNTARDAVNKLPDGQSKDELNHRLDEVQKEIDRAKELADQIADAVRKVEQAEQSKTQTDVDTAREAVNCLPNGQTKKDLNDRLDKIQNQINDGQPVKDIDSIKDPVVKAILLDAEQYVKLAEKHKNKTWIVSALGKVEAISPSIKSNPMYSALVQDLTDRANKVKDDFNSGISDQEAQQKISVATNYVTMYEKYKTSYYKTKAQSSVDVLPDGEVKTALQDKINAVNSK